MRADEKINTLRRIHEEADKIRKQLDISPPGEVLYRAELDLIQDKIVLVEADGFGGATTKVVEGNYPVDYFTKFEKAFATEEEAITAAEAVVLGKVMASSILSEQS